MIALADKAQQRLCRRFRRLAEHKPGRHGGGGPRAGRISVGGLAPEGGMKRGAVLGIRRTPTDVERARGM